MMRYVLLEVCVFWGVKKEAEGFLTVRHVQVLSNPFQSFETNLRGDYEFAFGNNIYKVCLTSFPQVPLEFI